MNQILLGIGFSSVVIRERRVDPFNPRLSLSPTLSQTQSKASRVTRVSDRTPPIPVLCIAPCSSVHGAVHTTLDVVIEVRGRGR